LTAALSNAWLTQFDGFAIEEVLRNSFDAFIELSSMKIGIPRESVAGEKRVAITPDVAVRLIAMGFTVAIEPGAGVGSDYADDTYLEAGAVLQSAEVLWSSADLILKVRSPVAGEVERMRSDSWLISFIWPAQQPDLMKQFAAQGLTVLAMDCVPRISRAQRMDALTSMANIAGYRAVIEAAHHFGRFFTGQVTAAGKVPPAKVFVVGAGVAGLSAIGVANGLGAIVRANDTRPEVADQIRSMGAEFVPVLFEEQGTGVGGYARTMSEGYQKAQRDTYARQAIDVDIIITTAQVPGKPAPKLITAGMVESMKPGSVIVDLAAEQGGNCELTEPGTVVVRNGVTIIGYTDMPSRLAKQSSNLYATNILRLMEYLCPNKDGKLAIDMKDDLARGTTVVLEGEIVWPPPIPKPALPSGATSPVVPSKASPIPLGDKKLARTGRPLVWVTIGIVLMMLVGSLAPPAFIGHFTVFVLACFVGYMVVWNVAPALHTPLMSVTNAISSIIGIGAVLQLTDSSIVIQLLAGVALTLTAINMFGGFAVTQRMLAMFRR
jgi:H+-translocating NAD(P) transhydrogenase subunit alpha